jgi:hypothetical protein
MKNTREILCAIMRTHGKVPLVNSLDNLRPLEKAALKQALQKLGVMLTELSYASNNVKAIRQNSLAQIKPWAGVLSGDYKQV